MPKFRTRIGYHPKLRLHYLVIPARVIAALGGKFRGRYVCRVVAKGAELKFQGGLVALGGGEGYITLAKARLAKLGAKADDSVTLELTEDRSKFGMAYPEELRALLAQDAEGRRRFAALAPGKQRYIVYYVGQVKSSHLRLERALTIIGNLKRVPTAKITFREMLRKD